MKMSFENFQIQKWVSQTAKKVDEKMDSFPFFLPELWSLNCPN